MTQALQEPAAVAVQNRDEVIARLHRLEPEVRAFLATHLFLFGSAARDELQPESDVDVFIDYDPAGPFSFVELIRLEWFLQRKLGRKVDLMTRAGLHRLLREEIERTAIKVF